MKTIECDFLVIGSGLAGLTAALRLSDHGQVVMITKKDSGQSNTSWAQGGVACVVDPQDSIQEHVQDTLATGAGLSDEAVVRAIVGSGPARIKELEKLGVTFARSAANGAAYDLGQEAGHSRRRVLHAGDITGREVVKVLLERVEEAANITVLPNHMAIDLVTTGWLGRGGENQCVGVYVLESDTGAIYAIRAPFTIMATGGAGKVYLYTSNPDIGTGDGMAMGWRAGLPVKNMEFVQFHPTCLYHPEVRSFLISEAVRGEGGVLVNETGESFTERYDPRGSLAPRDIVARAIDNEIKTRGDKCVYLDITHQPKAFLERRFPTIYATCLEYGFDMASDPVPVVPAAHYFCGGIEADVNGCTAMPGLFACGEVTCTGLHGANRLASNSLLEALVCAHNAADAIVSGRYAGGEPKVSIPPWEYGDAAPSDEAVVVEHNWDEVRTCMWDYVGIVRTDKRLERAMRRIRNLRREIRQYYLDYLVTSDVLELRNIADVAELIIRSASRRRESRGLHYTLDYPEASQKNPADTRILDLPGGPLHATPDGEAS